jgi:hypothetical protein
MSVTDRPRRAAVLAATRRAEDGAVEIDGVAPGTVYLVGGRVAYAETPGTPGVGERLVAAGRLTGEQWAALRELGHRGGDVAGVLAGYGLDRHELAALTESVTVDSLLALLTGPPGDDPVGQARFVAGVRHWMDPAVRLDESALEDVLALGAADSAHASIRAETIVETALPRWRWRVVTPDQWRAVCRIGNRARVRDLALAAAMGVYETVAQVAELVAAGLCTVNGAAATQDAAPGAEWPLLPRPAGPTPTVPAPAVPAPAENQVVGLDAPTVRISLVGGPPLQAPAAAPVTAEPTPGRSPGDLPRRLPGRSLSSTAPVLARRPRHRDPAGSDSPDDETLRRLLGSLQQLDRVPETDP